MDASYAERALFLPPDFDFTGVDGFYDFRELAVVFSVFSPYKYAIDLIPVGIEVQVIFHGFCVFGTGDEVFMDTPALIDLNEFGRFLEDDHADPSVGEGSGGGFGEAFVQFRQEGSGQGQIFSPAREGDGSFGAGHEEGGVIILVFRPGCEEGVFFSGRFSKLFFFFRKEGMADFIVRRERKGGEVFGPHFFPAFVMGHGPDFRFQIVFRAACHGKQEDEQQE